MTEYRWQLVIATVGGVLAVTLLTLLAQTLDLPFTPLNAPGVLGLVTGLLAAAAILYTFDTD